MGHVGPVVLTNGTTKGFGRTWSEATDSISVCPKRQRQKQEQSTAHIALVCAFSHGQWVGRSRNLAGHVGPVVLTNGTTKGFGRTWSEATDSISVCPKRQRQCQEQSTAHIALVCAFSHVQWVGRSRKLARHVGPVVLANGTTKGYGRTWLEATDSILSVPKGRERSRSNMAC